MLSNVNAFAGTERYLRVSVPYFALLVVQKHENLVGKFQLCVQVPALSITPNGRQTREGT